MLAAWVWVVADAGDGEERVPGSLVLVAGRGEQDASDVHPRRLIDRVEHRRHDVLHVEGGSQVIVEGARAIGIAAMPGERKATACGARLDLGDPDLIDYAKSTLGDRCRVTHLPTEKVGELFAMAESR